MAAAAYCRVSTEQQVEKESLDVQEARLRAYCVANGVDAPSIFRDEGLSGKDTHRPELNRLLGEVQAGKVQMVLVTRLDRITRSVRDLTYLIETFHRHGVEFVSLAENLDTSKPQGRFQITLLASLAQLERETTAERVAEVMHHRAAQGKWNGGVIPFGYTTQQRVLNEASKAGLSISEATERAVQSCPEPKVLYADEVEAALVKVVYDTYLATNSIRETVRRLNSAGYRTRSGGQWTSASIARMLSNPTYLGQMPYGRRRTDTVTGELKKVADCEVTLVEGSHPPLVDPDQYEAVQHALASRSFKKTRASRTYLLSGVLRCGKCGSPMYGSVYTKRDGREYGYYRCHARQGDHPTACDGLSIPVKQLEGFVVKTLFELSEDCDFLNDRRKMLQALSEEAEPGNSKTEAELRRLKSAERDLSSRMDVLLDSLETKLIERETFTGRYSKLVELLRDNRERQEALLELSASLDSRRVALEASFEAVASFSSNWDYLDDEGKAAKIQTIVKRITVTEHDMHLEVFLDGSPFPEFEEVSRMGARAGQFPYQLERSGPGLPAAAGGHYSILKPIPMTVTCPDYPRSAKLLPDLLRKIRLDLRLQIKQAAREAGVDEWSIINWEKGKCEPRRRLLERLVGVYRDRGHPEAEDLFSVPAARAGASAASITRRRGQSSP